VLLTTKFLDVAKFATLTPLPLLISYESSFPIVGLKISSLPTFALKSTDKMFMLCLWNDQIHILIPHRSCPLHHHSFPHMEHAHSA
jgi:hypothetical protein